MRPILIVEDERPIADLIELTLTGAGYTCEQVNDGETAADRIAEHDYELAILDIMLPKVDGYELLGYLRSVGTPVIFVTAKTALKDRVRGLHEGADDYLPKPFEPLELVARVKTQLRRYRRYNQEDIARQQKDAKPQEVQEYDIRGLWISQETHECTLNGQEIALTPIEFRILWYLCCHQGKVVPSEELYEQVWGEKYLDSNNTVMAHIARLREKLSEPARKPNYIKTVWGVGYKIEG